MAVQRKRLVVRTTQIAACVNRRRALSRNSIHFSVLSFWFISFSLTRSHMLTLTLTLIGKAFCALRAVRCVLCAVCCALCAVVLSAAADGVGRDSVMRSDFDEFCRLCQFNRNALVMGLAMDMLTAANYAKVRHVTRRLRCSVISSARD